MAALLLADDRVLLVRHRKGERRYHLLPGGGVEAGESLSDALIREVAEETGLRIEVGRPLLLSDTIDPSGGRHVVNVTFAATIIAGTPRAAPGDQRIEGVDLVNPTDLTELDLRPPIAPELIRILKEGAHFHTEYLGPRYVPE